MAVTEQDVRRVALSLPGTAEKSYNRLPGFRVRSKLFARIHELPDVLMVGVPTIADRDGIVAADPDKYFITPHYEFYPAMLVRLDQIDIDDLTDVLSESWLLAAPRKLRAEFEGTA